MGKNANRINERARHESVAVKNKLFVIGGLYTNNSEVFDSTIKNFTLLKQPTGFNLCVPHEVITIGSKIYVFKDIGEVIIYEFENNEWSLKKCQATRGKALFFLC